MSLRTALAPGARRWSVAVLGAACAAIGVAAYALFGGGAGASASGAVGTESVGAFPSTVINRMPRENLDYLWVDCVRTPHRFRGVRVVRCNVDFGEPHIVAYCSVLRNGRLLTSE